MHRFFIIFTILLCVKQIFSQEAAIQLELKQADKYTREENYEDALKHINNALEEEPLHLVSLEKKVNVMILYDSEKVILKEINSLIESYPQQPEYYYLRALIYLYRQKAQKAIDDIDKAEYYLMPEKYIDRIYLNRATAYYYLGDFLTAEQEFKKTIEINPKSAAAYQRWGMLKYEDNSYDDAIKYFNKSLLYQENNAIAYYNLGMAYFKVDEKSNACHNFNQSCILGNKNGCKIYILRCTD